MLNETVEININKFHGVPVLKGTRFPISQIISELSDDQKISEVANNYDLDFEKIVEFLKGLSIILDRSYY